MKFIIRWLISAIALFVAAAIVPGIEVQGNAYVALGVTALILGFLNAVIRPILTLLSCGFIVLTLGLFIF
jgi:putative membrane protein